MSGQTVLASGDSWAAVKAEARGACLLGYWGLRSSGFCGSPGICAGREEAAMEQGAQEPE